MLALTTGSGMDVRGVQVYDVRGVKRWERETTRYSLDEKSRSLEEKAVLEMVRSSLFLYPCI